MYLGHQAAEQLFRVRTGNSSIVSIFKVRSSTVLNDDL